MIVFRPAPRISGTLYQHATCPGIRALTGIDTVIVSERARGGGYWGRGTEAMRHWVGRKDDQVQSRPEEGRASGATTKNTSCS